MSSTNILKNPNSIRHLRREIERLRDEQSEALKHATFVGMTAEDARACDERRNRITLLMQQLSRLQQTE